MSAPFLWIFLPAAAAVLLWFLRHPRLVTLLACLLTFLLALAAWMLPVDQPLDLLGLGFKLSPAFSVLGRQLVLEASDRALMVMIYGSACFLFMPAAALQIAHRLVPYGLLLTALLVASLAVEPFLYAALLIEMAVLLAVPMLSPPGRSPGQGLLRFLIFQSLAMPFLLFSGWLLAGIEANPGDVGLVGQAAILIGLGFAFLLAVFPFHTWIPMLAEETHPYIFGFVLWLFPTAALFFGLGFLDGYTWLRNSAQLDAVLTSVGTLMVVTGGLLAAFQRHLTRILGYALIAALGYSLLAIRLVDQAGLNLFLLLFLPRLISIGQWCLGLAVLRQQAGGLDLERVRGLGRQCPYATAGLLLGGLGLAGMPLLAGFPAQQAIWAGLAPLSPPAFGWTFLGSIGLVFAAIRSLAILMSAPQAEDRPARESRSQRLLLIAGGLAMLLLGLLPNWVLRLWQQLPALFEHLKQ